jgi:hypothetical protein
MQRGGAFLPCAKRFSALSTQAAAPEEMLTRVSGALTKKCKEGFIQNPNSILFTKYISLKSSFKFKY